MRPATLRRAARGGKTDGLRLPPLFPISRLRASVGVLHAASGRRDVGRAER